jgi:hypothetical protein
MITAILSSLALMFQGGDLGGEALGGAGGLQNILSIFDVTQMIPAYFIQISIGIYLIEIIFILTSALVTVDAGKDTLREKYETASNLNRGLFLYLATAIISTISLTLLATIALGSLN